METTLTKDGNIFTLKATGQIDIQTNPQFEKAVRSALDEKLEKLILDFSELDLISSAGIRTLIQAGKEVNKTDREIEFLISNHGIVKEIFYTTGIYSLFNVAEIGAKKA